MSSTINIRVEEELKAKAQETFDKLGLDLTSGIRIYLNQVVIREGIPFDVTLRKSELELAIEDIESDRVNSYKNLDELFKELDNEDWNHTDFCKKP